MTDDLLSPQDAAAIAGVPAAQLLRWIAEQPSLRDGEAFRGPGIRYVGPRHRPRFRREDVERWRERVRKAQWQAFVSSVLITPSWGRPDNALYNADPHRPWRHPTT